MEPGELADKDVFPTPEMHNKEGEQVVWAGPGMTVLEYTTIEMTKALASSSGGWAVADHDLAQKGYRLARAVIARLEAGHDLDIAEEEPS